MFEIILGTLFCNCRSTTLYFVNKQYISKQKLNIRNLYKLCIFCLFLLMFHEHYNDLH